MKNKNVLFLKKYFLFNPRVNRFQYQNNQLCLLSQFSVKVFISKLIKTHTSKGKYNGFAKILSNMIAHHYWGKIQVFQYLTSLKSCGKPLKSKRHTCCLTQFSVAALFVGFLAKRRRFSAKIRAQKLHKYILV